ncbi:MAG: alpha-hydroxy-acid oxidizing protein [Gemmatimonadota bacterium]|nr:alpha-hydroxy-acid oxidizing protein [Gemmatimonadota bacterium]
MSDRREFLRFLAGSPLLAAAGMNAHVLHDLTSESPRRAAGALSLAQRAMQQAVQQTPPNITAAREALDVFDFEPVAKANIPVGHWAYLASGTDDDGTIRANREGFDHWVLRARRLVNVARVDASVTLYGTRYPTPIVINPVGSQKAFHPLGEMGVARAAKVKVHLQVLSTVATTSIEDAIAARGATVWFQLYHQPDWAKSKQMVQRAERAGSAAVVFTVDLIGGSNRETMIRGARLDTRDCKACHLGGAPIPGITGASNGDNRRKPNLNGYPDVTPIPEVGTPTWEFVDRLKASTKMKVLVKGIVTREDAELAIKHGVDGLFVSNHGGRADNSMRATITSLPEVVQGVRGRIPIICDGGFRRGTDVFKAMALGATSIGIGRPYIWGLGAFGQEGVETVLELLRHEFEVTMKQMGTPSIAAITRAHIDTNYPSGTRNR